MKVHQMLPNYWYGDAIGNSVRQIQELLAEWGHESEVFADAIHEKRDARFYTDFLLEDPGAPVIYHYSTGSRVNRFVLENAGNIILMYHNITPAKYFEEFDVEAARNCLDGREFLGMFRGRVQLAIAVSPYNAEELTALGVGPVAVAPLILDFDKITPSGKKPFGDGKTNILFVGRVAPQKRHEDILQVFHHYRKHVDENSRLVFVGGYGENDAYYRYLQGVIKALDIPDVIFAGHLPDEVLGDYFQNASFFLCMSEHEGVCVPLLEAMRFGVPVIAREGSGVTHTMSGAGALVGKEAKAHEIAELMGIINDDPPLREKMIGSQFARLKDFDKQKLTAHFRRTLEKALNGAPAL